MAGSIDVIKKIVATYCSKVEHRANTRIIKGRAEASSLLRTGKIELIAEELEKAGFKPQIKTSKKIGTKTYRSGSKLVVVNTKEGIEVIILLKPITSEVQNLGPSSFSLTGKTFKITGYEGEIIPKIYDRAKLPTDEKQFLAALTEDVSTGNFTYANGKYSLAVSEETALFFNDSSYQFYTNLNKQFSEVLSPLMVKKDYPELETFSFPVSETQAGSDFTAFTKSGFAYNYSVKSGVTKKVNTLKPDSIMQLIGSRKLPAKLDIQEEYEVIKILAELGSVNGVVKVAKKLGYNLPIDTTSPTSIQQAITFIEVKSKTMNFHKLVAFAIENQLTFIKFSYRFGKVEFQFLKSDDVMKLQQDKKIYLRGKGFKPDGSMNDKLGLTPP